MIYSDDVYGAEGLVVVEGGEEALADVEVYLGYFGEFGYGSCVIFVRVLV